MEVEEEKQHEGIQQYYITKIEALQVSTHVDVDRSTFDLCVCGKNSHTIIYLLVT